MKIENLGIYDIVSFIVPGNTFLFILYFFSKQYFQIETIIPIEKEAFLIIPCFFLSYIFGLFFGEIGKKLFELLFNKKNSISNIMINYDDKELHKKYQKAYYTLIAKDKAAISNILYAQYSFSRNCSAMLFVSILINVVLLSYNTYHNLSCTLLSIVIVTLLFLFILCGYISRKRYTKMVQEVFYTYHNL